MLKSQENSEFKKFEIIVIDNASIISSKEIIRTFNYYNQSNRYTKNLGYTCGNNAGIKKALGEYFFLKNNDAFVKSDKLDHLIKLMDGDISN